MIFFFLDCLFAITQSIDLMHFRLFNFPVKTQLSHNFYLFFVYNMLAASSRSRLISSSFLLKRSYTMTATIIDGKAIAQ